MKHQFVCFEPHVLDVFTMIHWLDFLLIHKAEVGNCADNLFEQSGIIMGCRQSFTKSIIHLCGGVKEYFVRY